MTSACRPPPGGRLRAWVALLTLAGFALRLPLLGRFPLREDEAIYGFWALHGWYVDPLFLQVWPDKPPILLWVLGLAFQLCGHAPLTAEPAARYASIAASTLTIPVLTAVAHRWWGRRAAVAAGALAALNPFAISFAPTAFTDPLLVLAGSLALALAVRRRRLWSGVWLGVAIMTKQQGLLFAPLVVGALMMAGRPPRAFGSDSKQKQLKPIVGGHNQAGWVARFAGLRFESGAAFLLGLAVVVIPILYWDSLRWAVAPSPWDLGATNVGGVALLPPGEWPARAKEWAQLTAYLLASPWVWGAYTLVLLGGAVQTVRGRAPVSTWLPAALLATWAAGFLLLHIATSVQVWDRYLLPLMVPLALLGGWAAAAIAAHAHSVTYAGGVGVMPALLLALLLAFPPAWQAAQGQLPVGGDHGDYAGLNEALAAVDGPDTLLFHRELGWHARFTLFDPVRSGAVELRYYPSSVYLADSATKSPHKQRYVIVPDWSPLPDLAMQLAMRGLQAHVTLRAGHFTVYQIEERPGGDASWRVCAP